MAMIRNRVKAKRKDNGEWIKGFYVYNYDLDTHHIFIGNVYLNDTNKFKSCETIPETLCRCTELDDKDSEWIWENDILEYDGDGYAKCIGVVKYGTYVQDGSGGEYSGRECIGFYVEMVKLIPYEWENESVEEILEYFPHYYKKYSLAEILKQKDVKKVGNIFDNSELLEDKR